MNEKQDTQGAYEDSYLTPAQLKAELDKCEYCEEKPCREACPCHCSPADFCKAVEQDTPHDYQRAAGSILSQNPLGTVCGLVCPDYLCMAACVHRTLDASVRIPLVQATILHRARELGAPPQFTRAPDTGKRVAVIGGGPAGLGAAAFLGLSGHRVTIHEKGPALGGMCLAIPETRLDRDALQEDLQWLLPEAGVELELSSACEDPRALLDEGFDAVIVTTGLWTPFRLGVDGEDAAIPGTDYLSNPAAYPMPGVVAVVGGGAVALDCATTALAQGARRVEMIALENLTEMPLSGNERRELLESPIDVSGRTRVDRIQTAGARVSALTVSKICLAEGRSFSLDAVQEVPGSAAQRADFDHVVVAIGNRGVKYDTDDERIFLAGDCAEGPTTVVEAAASGKTAGERVHALLAGQTPPAPPPRNNGRVKSRTHIPGYDQTPVPLETDFFGRTIPSPFLLSAAPPTDGLEQMRLAYEAGWAGGIMKTAFDGIPIHIPSRYMYAFNDNTYANCDNVSGHGLDRICREVETLVSEFPDRLTVASTGGPVTGDDEQDMKGWQGNTRMLEQAGAMAIEYSLSCPQGGDGTEGDIVSQNARLTARIIDWILTAGEADVPKLFKLTGAVTSIEVIVSAIKEVLDRHPDKKAGVTLANTFPTLAFRPGQKKTWDEGVIVGMSGEGALHISNLSLAKVAHLGVAVSGNGGPMDYRAAANFLALGARNVQFCTIVMKNGYRIVNDLHAGLSHLMAARGLASVEELIGVALPSPVTDFMDLSPVKQLSTPDRDLCLRCGNCTRCPYLAISLDEEGYPSTDPARCIGCSICSLKCFARAITMQERTPEQAAALKED